VAIEDAGLEIRDQVQWLYGSGFPKSHNIKEGVFEGWGTALKPANEPICLARKPLEKGLTVAESVIKWGTGAINIDASRVGMQPAQTYTAPDITGDAFNSDVSKRERKIVSVPAQGRWPANIILDEVAAELLDAQSGISKSTGGGKLGFFNNTDKNTSMGDGSAEFYTPKKNMGKGDVGGASRFFYVAKASKRERNAGLEGMPLVNCGMMEDDNYAIKTGSGNLRDTKNQNHHPTVKPVKLMEYLIKMITPPGGVVLDPFMGSGTTGVAAKNLGFDFIGIELSAEYVEIAKQRIEGNK
jgi:site-specific DNA-methyltransferase (adenine-specific)